MRNLFRQTLRTPCLPCCNTDTQYHLLIVNVTLRVITVSMFLYFLKYRTKNDTWLAKTPTPSITRQMTVWGKLFKCLTFLLQTDKRAFWTGQNGVRGMV